MYVSYYQRIKIYDIGPAIYLLHAVATAAAAAAAAASVR